MKYPVFLLTASLTNCYLLHLTFKPKINCVCVYYWSRELKIFSTQPQSVKNKNEHWISSSLNFCGPILFSDRQFCDITGFQTSFRSNKLTFISDKRGLKVFVVYRANVFRFPPILAIYLSSESFIKHDSLLWTFLNKQITYTTKYLQHCFRGKYFRIINENISELLD